ncbi:DUF6485 family protein [Candidatus Margulisiibacteriota bacterium]
MKCPIKQKNMEICNCTYEPCSRKGICCECMAYHRKSYELPACYFDEEKEKTHDRSVDYFVKRNQ